jgi:hypothetical protein
VQIDKAGQYADFDDGDGSDTIPPTASALPNTPSLAYSPQTGKLLFVYQNNINRPISQADISYQTSDRRWTALVGRSVPVDRLNRPARGQRPVLPVGRIG